MTTYASPGITGSLNISNLYAEGGVSAMHEASATELAGVLSQVENRLPPGKVLEVGCGRGIFSTYLASSLSGRTVVFTDPSSPMVESCRRNLKGLHYERYQHRIFSCLDATTVTMGERFALIATSFALHRFGDLKRSIARLIDLLLPGGYLIVSLPGRDSFLEWKQICAFNSLVYTGKELPGLFDLVETGTRDDCTFQLLSVPHTLTFADAGEFFRQLDQSGLETTMPGAVPSGNKRLTVERWNLLYGKPSIEVSYQTLSGYFRKLDQGGLAFAVETKVMRKPGKTYVLCDRFAY
ncbi:MAG: methyltransferase domain-containing protein [Cyanobacteria bacterium HKST-UBA02]|nr:methyltransferase domain-containing protein [Cyanobacteria bacterium HKST-UBA02]